MPDIHIHRQHDLGFLQARQIACTWAAKAEKKFDMECTYEEGDTEDTLVFSRTGVKGTLLVDAQQFEMKAQLGFLLGAFKDRIEQEISHQLDALLKPARAESTQDLVASAGKAKTAACTAPDQTATPTVSKTKKKA